MALDENTEALMLAYVYGEVSASAAKAFEARMDADAELRAEVEGLVATRDLLGKDAAFGARSGIDAPPPHLVDAIMNAEALARPAEIRQAALARSGTSATPPLTARLARWLLGGGVLAGAAAFLFVVTRTSVEMAPSSTLATADAPAAEPIAVPPPPAPASAKMAETVPAPEPEGAFGEKPREPAPVEAPIARERAKDEAFADVPGEAADTADRLSALSGLADAKVMRDAAKEEAAGGASLGAASAWDDRSPKGASTGTMALSSPPPPAMAAPPAPAPDSAPADKDAPARNMAKAKKADAPASVDDDFPFDDSQSTKPHEKAEPKPASKPAPEKSAAGPGRAEADVDGAPAPAKPVVLGREEVEARRRALAEKKTAGTRGQGASAGEMERARTIELANIALMTGQRELARKSYLLALDEFTKAAELDPDGAALGATPVLGQMRALLALKRPTDAVRVSRVLLRRDLKQVDVVPALVLAAETAERTGDLRNAREIYSRLLDAPAERSRARAALNRISAAEEPRRTMDSEAAEAAQEPAAASKP